MIKDNIDLSKTRILPRKSDPSILEPHRFIGVHSVYSVWESLATGETILGDPYWKLGEAEALGIQAV